MSLLNEIEPLKQTALAELRAAPDLAALEQAKGAWIGPNGKFTALMKQLGTLSKEEKPAAGKLINAAKVELEAALASRREELELKVALPKEPTDFTLPDAAARSANCIRSHRSPMTSSAPSAKSVSPWLTARRLRTSIIASTRSTRPPTIPRATARILFIWRSQPIPNSHLPTPICSELIRVRSKSA